jgi:putative ABC transport system permease protein
MNWLIVKNDLVRNKVINLALLLFMIFSATLAVLSVLITSQTISSISELYSAAAPPHFVQMHKGDLDQHKIDLMMSGYNGITSWQTVAMIDVYGENLTVVGQAGTYDLSDFRLDIGLVKQNPTQDLLLNARHEKVTLNEGEIGIPVLLKDRYDLRINDRVILQNNGMTREFVVKEFVLDSMMNSSMVSSTRILLSDSDFNSLQGKVGEPEYLIEAYLSDVKAAPEFKSAYENAGLPQNGQAVTYSIIFLLSALTDSTTVFVLFLVSLLLIWVSFICVKFTIMAALEEEVREIGIMKAIGLQFADIRNIYLYKYRVLAAAGVTTGFILAHLLRGLFTRHISTSFGGNGLIPSGVVYSLIAAVLVFVLMNGYCLQILKKIKHVTVVDSLVNGRGFGKEPSRIKNGLHSARKLPVNWLLGVLEISNHFISWVIVFSVLLIAVMMIMIPANVLNTFEAPEFITYMGSSMEDILIEIETGENLDNHSAKVIQLLKQDPTVENFNEFRSIRVQTTDAAGRPLNMNIDCGALAGNELQYLQGQAPAEGSEIALSFLNADEIGKSVGDTLELHFQGEKKPFVISGVYQDVTSGGYTAKSKHDFTGVAVNKYSFSVDLKDPSQAEITADHWARILGAGISVDPMEEFIDQTLGGVAKQLRAIVIVIAIVGAALTMLMTVLFLKLRLAKDFSEIAILKAIGFSDLDIRKQYLVKVGCISVIGLLAGVILTTVTGNKIIEAALSVTGLGVKSVELMINPLIQYLLCPAGLLALVLLVTWVVTRAVKNDQIVSMIQE